MNARDLTNTADVIDVRDLVARVEELRAELEEVKDETSEQAGETPLSEWIASLNVDAHPFVDSLEELATLESLLDDLAGNGGDEQWEGAWYPVTLVRDSYFRDYAQELAEESGWVPTDAPWPARCIDWEQAAWELRMDYTSTEFDGVTYWYR